MPNEPIVQITPAFKGAITASDLLSTEGTLSFTSDRSSIHRGGDIFKIVYGDFSFYLSIQNSSLVFQRNETLSILYLNEVLEKSEKVSIFAVWNHDSLTLDCRSPVMTKRAEAPTTPAAPPASLIKWARKNSLLPVDTYHSEEDEKRILLLHLS